jgi:peptidoglycan/LPS O-acetylase OafA/YrhL
MRDSRFAAASTLALLAAAVSTQFMSSEPYLSQVLSCVAAGLLVFLAAQDRGAVSPLAMPKILDWIGARSYSIYLAHVPVTLSVVSSASLVAKQHGGALDFSVWWPLLALLSLVGTGAAAELSFRYFEVLPRRLFTKRKAPVRDAVMATT